MKSGFSSQWMNLLQLILSELLKIENYKIFYIEILTVNNSLSTYARTILLVVFQLDFLK